MLFRYFFKFLKIFLDLNFIVHVELLIEQHEFLVRSIEAYNGVKREVRVYTEHH